MTNTSAKQSLLDFGCGNGLFLKYLMRKNYTLSLTGYDPFFMSYRSDFPQKGVCIHTSLSTLSGEKFDFITALDVIEHIQNDREAIMQMSMLLKKGGNLLVTVPA